MKHLFFDLDRTLWDFEKNSRAALEILYTQLQLSDHTKSFESFYKAYKKINGRLWQQYGAGKLEKDVLRIKRFEDTFKSFQIDPSLFSEEMADGYVEISPRQTHIFPHAHETLTQLKADGHQLHIITNGFLEVQHIKLENCDLKDYFDIIVCSEEVGKNKPAPEVFHHAMQLAGATAKESVMIGDDFKVDILGAERVGMAGILFDSEKTYNSRTHEWHIHTLDRIPEILPWIAQAQMR